MHGLTIQLHNRLAYFFESHINLQPANLTVHTWTSLGTHMQTLLKLPDMHRETLVQITVLPNQSDGIGLGSQTTQSSAWTHF